MLEIYSNNLAYLHIYKTAGISVRTMLASMYGVERQITFNFGKFMGRTHHTLEELSKVVDISRPDKILVTVRNPFARAVSIYEYAVRTKRDKDLELTLGEIYPEMLVVRDYDFETFVDWFVETQLAQKDYILVDGKVPDNVRIIRLEHLKKDLERELGCSVSLERLNATEHKPFIDYYNDATLEKVYNKEKWRELDDNI